MAKKKERIKELEKEVQSSDFWKDEQKAIKITRELSELREKIGEFEKLKEELESIKEIVKEDKSSFPPSLPLRESSVIEEFEKKLREKELQVFLSGKYDRNDAILSIYSGAGGQDAQDWTTMLLRMYERYCQRKGYKTKILHQSFAEGGGPEGRIGTKSVTLEIRNKYAFGLLKKESGVHRLVRISPFSAKSLRHTSFALVEVVPVISKKEELEVEIKPEDLKLETFRASGPGGQYVNRRESAVRITHLPTGIKVACQSERLQGLNRQKAMKILRAKLYQLRIENTAKKIKQIRGKQISASWGNQIRSYVFHPYRLVKDLRTGVESSDVEGVLDGNLDQFIEAEIKT